MPPVKPPPSLETEMAGRGNENRQKTHSVLVRLTMAEHERLTALADREGAPSATGA